jgi:hypothetical protein
VPVEAVEARATLAETEAMAALTPLPMRAVRAASVRLAWAPQAVPEVPVPAIRAAAAAVAAATATTLTEFRPGLTLVARGEPGAKVPAKAAAAAAATAATPPTS